MGEGIIDLQDENIDVSAVAGNEPELSETFTVRVGSGAFYLALPLAPRSVRVASCGRQIPFLVNRRRKIGLRQDEFSASVLLLSSRYTMALRFEIFPGSMAAACRTPPLLLLSTLIGRRAINLEPCWHAARATR
jgi:hypothetical protein